MSLLPSFLALWCHRSIATAGRSTTSGILTLMALFLVAPLSASMVGAAEETMPGAPRLLPEKTLAYARIADANQIREDFGKSSLGQMLNDPRMQPVASDVYTTLAELFGRISQEVGVSLDELLSIPSGQLAVAMVPLTLGDEAQDDETAEQSEPAEGSEEDESADDSAEAIERRIDRKRRQQNGFAGVFMIDAGENVDKLRAVVDRLEQRILDAGNVRRESTVENTTLVRLLPPRPGRPTFEYFQRGDCIVFGIGHDTAADVLDRWLERTDSPSLADSRDFTAVMSRSVGAEATRPQLTFYVDPYHIVERIAKRSPGAGFFWPIMMDLGIDKIRGAGGSMFRGGEFFDDIMHFHVLIDPPRDGIFGVLRPEPVETLPPDWVPADVTSYSTLGWNFEAALDNVEKIVDQFQGDGAFQRNVIESVQERLKVDLRDEVLANLSGRYVSLRWLQPPVTINSQTQLHALKLTDVAKATTAFEKLRRGMPNGFVPEVIGGTMIYFSRQGDQRLPQGFRKPEPCVFILDNYFIFCDSRELVERVIRAHSGAVPQLAEEPDYALVSGELGGKLDGEKPFYVSFVRGSDFLRQFYEMAQSDDTRRFLRGAAENNIVAKQFHQLLQRHELPPYEEFKKYFAPSGMFGYDEPTGIHFGSFTLKPMQ